MHSCVASPVLLFFIAKEKGKSIVEVKKDWFSRRTALSFHQLKPAWKDFKTFGRLSAVPCTQLYLLSCQTIHAFGEQQTCPWITAVMSEVYIYVHICIYKKIKGDSTFLAVLYKDVLQHDKG